MTRAKIPTGCDICGLEIKSEKNYTFEVYDGSPWAKTQVKGENMDCCHKCFLDICKQEHFNGAKYIPEWKTAIKNPKYVKGGTEPYRIPKVETTTQTLDITEKVAA